MSTPGDDKERLRAHFLGWQCRIRQYAIRQEGGRPTEGMRPAVLLEGGREPAARITVLIVKREPEQTTAEFRHLVRSTHDPAERYERALRAMAAAHYQRANEFSEELTALFSGDSALARHLIVSGTCSLGFEQFSQRYELPCSVRSLAAREPAYQATYWHNHLFNPSLPPGILVLGFKPDWAEAIADPPI